MQFKSKMEVKNNSAEVKPGIKNIFPGSLSTAAWLSQMFLTGLSGCKHSLIHTDPTEHLCTSLLESL